MTATGPRSRRRSAILIAAFVAIVVIGIEGVRFVQVALDLQTARAALLDAATVAEREGTAITPEDVTQIADDLSRADTRLVGAGDVLDGDPLLAILRLIPPVATQIDGASRMVSAAQGLTAEHAAVAGLMARYVEIRGTSTGADRMARLITFAAGEQGSIGALLDAVDAADAEIAGLSDDDLVGPLAAARADIGTYLDRLAAPSARARSLLRAVPSLFGIGSPSRFLVLALDSAELRPVGGLIAAFATPSVADGKLGDVAFRDIGAVDRPVQRTYVPPPAPLQDHLLGDFTWQVADAGWWPDFARSADEARRMFAVETGDDAFDGVIAFTPDFVDALIGVIGPVEVPGTGITVEPGETYVRSLEEAEIRNTGPLRKRFLADLASAVLRGVEALPPDRYPALIEALAGAVERRQIQVLPDDATARAAMVEIGAYTPFTFEDGADRLAVMGANVAPVSKLHALLDMDHDLEVVLRPDGSADERLTTTYDNRFGPELPPGLAGVAASFVYGNLGTYERRYLSPRAEVLSVRSIGSDQPVTDPEALEVESGCLVVGNYLFVRPGQVGLETTYRTPDVVQRGAGADRESIYRLRFRKQPGRDADGLVVRVTVPDGARPTTWSDGGTANGSVVTFTTTTAVDQLFEVTFTTP